MFSIEGLPPVSRPGGAGESLNRVKHEILESLLAPPGPALALAIPETEHFINIDTSHSMMKFRHFLVKAFQLHFELLKSQVKRFASTIMAVNKD